MSMKTATLALVTAFVAGAAEMKTVKLPAPDRQGGKPLMQALALRRTTREFNAKKPLPDAMLGNLLWAANGFNRDDKRTAPTARNIQEIELYVIKADGTWFYDAKNHALVQRNTADLRADTVGPMRGQMFAANAAAIIVIVADTSRQKDKWYWMDAGYVSQNIYLYCASEGLNTVVRGMFPEDLSAKMGLEKKYSVIATQPVGY